MKIVLTNIIARVQEATEEEHSLIDELLRWKDKSARHNRFYKGDGYIRLYNRFSEEFPAGFMRVVWEAAKARGFEVLIADKRTKPCDPDPNADLGWLRWYQTEAVETCQTRRRGVVWSPTGSGKTEMIAAMALSMPCRWLMLVNDLGLVEQCAERYELRTGMKAGIIGGGRWEPDDRLTCATFQTFYRRLKKGDAEAKKLISEAEGLLIDEVHDLPANSYTYVSNAAVNAYYRLGFSGTPLLRDDDKSQYVIAATGPIIYRIKAQTLIDEGVLAKPKITMVRCEQSNPHVLAEEKRKSSKARGKYWAKTKDSLIIDSKERNELIVELVKKAEKPCLCFVVQLEHGAVLGKMIQDAGIPCEFVDGNKITKARRAAIKRLEYGETDVIVCTVVFNKGIDIPELRSVVIAGGGKSAIATLQRIGRGMRVTEDKSDFEVWDIDDCGSLLETHAKKRREAYAIEGYDVADSF